MIPKHTEDAIKRYVLHSLPPGDFLYSVLCNDLVGACAQADVVNRAMLFDIVAYLYNEIPVSIWGSSEKVNKWLSDPDPETKEFIKNHFLKQ